MQKRRPISRFSIKIKRIFGVEICSNFFRDTFTINIDLVSDVNLERETSTEPENNGLEANIKTRVCRGFSWQQTLGLGSIHLGETQDRVSWSWEEIQNFG